MRPAPVRHAVLAALLAASAAATAAPASRFAPCPSAPHCVSSRETGERHGIAPFMLTAGDGATWDQVVASVHGMERTTVVTSDEHYLHAEITSPWGIYTDDLELLRDPAGSRVDVRSSSRIGYYDFNVNRDRVEALRRRLAGAGLIQPSDP